MIKKTFFQFFPLYFGKPKTLWFTFVFVLLSFFYTSCQEKEVPLRMERAKLVALLADIHLAEAAMNNVYGKAKDSLAILYYDQVYAIHGVNPLLFEEQIAILKKQPELMASIYEEVLIKVQALEAKEIDEQPKKSNPSKN